MRPAMIPGRPARRRQIAKRSWIPLARTAVILKTVSVRYSVPPGTFGSARLLVTPFGGGSAVGVPLPTPRVAPVSQAAGLYDGYAGALDLGGLPAVVAQYCQSGVDSAGSMAVIGFTVTP